MAPDTRPIARWIAGRFNQRRTAPAIQTSGSCQSVMAMSTTPRVTSWAVTASYNRILCTALK